MTGCPAVLYGLLKALVLQTDEEPGVSDAVPIEEEVIHQGARSQMPCHGEPDEYASPDSGLHFGAKCCAERGTCSLQMPQRKWIEVRCDGACSATKR